MVPVRTTAADPHLAQEVLRTHCRLLDFSAKTAQDAGHVFLAFFAVVSTTAVCFGPERFPGSMCPRAFTVTRPSFRAKNSTGLPPIFRGAFFRLFRRPHRASSAKGVVLLQLLLPLFLKLLFAVKSYWFASRKRPPFFNVFYTFSVQMHLSGSNLTHLGPKRCILK